MLNTQEFEQGFSNYRERPPVSYIRVFHASPDAPPVDVYADNKIIAKNIPYRAFTQYLKVVPGNYSIKIFPAGKTTNPVINTSLHITPNSIFTLAAGGTLSNIKLYAIPETVRPIPQDRAMIRFGHLSPNAPNVDIALPDGTRILKNVAFSQITRYIPVNAGTNTIDIIPTGTNKSVLHIPNITLKPNRFYTIYAVGLVNGRPPLEALIPLDGNSYIKF